MVSPVFAGDLGTSQLFYTFFALSPDLSAISMLCAAALAIVIGLILWLGLAAAGADSDSTFVVAFAVGLSGPLAFSDSRILALGPLKIRPRRAGVRPSGPVETFVFP